MRANSLLTFVSFVLWVSLATVPQAAGRNPQSAPREQTAAQALTVPFELYDNFVFLQVRVNGSEARSFLLDTGASTPFLNETLADSLALAPKRQHETNIAAGESSTKLGLVKNIVLSLATVICPHSLSLWFLWRKSNPE